MYTWRTLKRRALPRLITRYRSSSDQEERVAKGCLGGAHGWAQARKEEKAGTCKLTQPGSGVTVGEQLETGEGKFGQELIWHFS